MSRPKGTKNKTKPAAVETFSYSPQQRIELLADLIVERVIQDRRFGRHLLALAGDRSEPRH